MLLAAPIFFGLNTASLRIGMAEPARAFFRSPNTVNLSVTFLIWPLLVLVLKRNNSETSLAVPFAVNIFVLVNIASFIAGALFRPVGSDFVAAGFLYQTLVPIVVGWSVASYLNRSAERILAFIRALAATALVFALLHTIATIVTGTEPSIGYQSSIFFFENSKALRFFPTMVAVSLVLFVHTRLPESRVYFRVPLIFAGLFILLVGHSRWALVSALLGIVALAWQDLFRKDPKYAGLALLGSGIAIFGVTFGSRSLLEFSSGSSVERFVGDSTTGGASDQRRIDAVISSGTETLSTPFGLMYRPTVETVTSGREGFIARVTNSESQITEVGARAGVLATIAIILISVAVLKKALVYMRSGDASTSSIGLASFMLTFGLLVQLNSSETYVGPIFWIFAFLTISGRSAFVSTSDRSPGKLEFEYPLG